MATPRERRRALKRAAGVLVGAAALVAPLVGGSPAGAQSVLDPADPCPPGVATPAAPFNDRGGVATVHVRNVDCAYALDIVLGGAGGVAGRYDPAGPVRRDQMAGFIARSLRAAGYTLPAPGAAFPDVPSGNVFADDIRRLRAAGITLGKANGTYGPGDNIARDQMASFLIRAAEFAYGDPGGLRAEGPGTFTDVPAGNVHKPAIDAAYELFGLVLGTAPGTYAPAANTRRDQMATFVVRLVDITLVTP